MRNHKNPISFPFLKLLYSLLTTLGLFVLALALMLVCGIFRTLVETSASKNSSLLSEPVRLQISQKEVNAMTDTDSNSSGKFFRITRDTFLLRSADILDQSQENVFFILPATYYVKVLSTNQTTGVCYAEYNNISGFVELSALSPASESPNDPHYSSLASLSSAGSTHIRQTPSCEEDQNILAVLHPFSQSISVLGWVYGDTPNDGTSKMWYYCAVRSSDTILYVGYVYSERLTLSNPFEPLEDPEISLPSIPTSGTNVSLDNEADLNHPAGLTKESIIILVVVFSIPILAIFGLLIFSPKKQTKTKQNQETPKTKPRQVLDSIKPLSDKAHTVSDNTQTLSDSFNSLSNKSRTTSDSLRPAFDTPHTTSDSLRPVADNTHTLSGSFNPLSNKTHTTSDSLRPVSDNTQTLSGTFNSLSNKTHTVSDSLRPVADNTHTLSDSLRPKAETSRTFSDKFGKTSDKINTVPDIAPPSFDPSSPFFDKSTTLSEKKNKVSDSIRALSEKKRRKTEKVKTKNQGINRERLQKSTFFEKFFVSSPRSSSSTLSFPPDDEPL